MKSVEAPAEETPIRVGISSCLLGQKVRYDGGHKRDAFLTDVFGPFVEWVPVCPEVEFGMGIPRESIRLVRDGEDVRLVGERSRTDYTATMRPWVRKRARELEKFDLCGYVLKKDSPSCGMERVRVYDANGVPSKTGRGLFADALISHFEALPVEEEGRLNDARLRENFVERVFAYHRLRALFSGRWTLGKLVAFHTAHKLQLLAHSPAGYRELGRLVASARRRGGTSTSCITSWDTSAVGSTTKPEPSFEGSSTTTARGSFRSWCRSRCWPTTCAGSASRTSWGRSIWNPTRKS
jgi:uncharacterized protein YbbK (DUF523 family)